MIILLGNIPSTAECLVTKLGTVVCHLGPECHARRLVSVFKFKVTVKAYIIKYDCLCHIDKPCSFLNVSIEYLFYLVPVFESKLILFQAMEKAGKVEAKLH